MALFPYDELDRTLLESPMERTISRIFNDFNRDYEPSFGTLTPYWLDQPMLQECNIGNTLGTLVNSPEKYGLEVDVSQFRPEELSVNLRDDQLVVEGHHEERNDNNGRIERHFIRKCTIPEDVDPQSIESHLSDKGVLSIGAKKLAIEKPKGRTIPIQVPHHLKRLSRKKRSMLRKNRH